MNEPNFILTLETHIGSNLRLTVIDAIRIAKTLNVTVTFDFWDEKLNVYPDTEVDKFFTLNKKRLKI